MENKRFRMLQTVRLVLFEWQPNWIFYRSYLEWLKGDDNWAGSDLFGNKTHDHGHFIYWPIYTRLGQWFEDMPGIFSILKLPWYIIVWPLYLVFIFIWIFIFEIMLIKSDTRYKLSDLYRKKEKVWEEQHKKPW